MSKVIVGHFDGASRGNPGPAAIGCILLDAETGEVLWEKSQYLGEKTNNEAEYLALIELLKYLRETKARGVWVRGDSQLVVNQVNGSWRVKEPHLWPLCAEANELISETRIANLKWVPREQNRQADRLSNEALNEALNQGTKTEKKVFDMEKLEHLSGAIYVAHGTKDYAVDLENHACTCPAFQRSKNCKHLLALERMVIQDVSLQNL
ncbi:14.7 kDa ribonuclease H-like protein [Peptococcaceae bacterium CEB3]|nr:14.7 kDa ribonuclease H-like protein [Peptococcaceae bacterium CEB3]